MIQFLICSSFIEKVFTLANKPKLICILRSFQALIFLAIVVATIVLTTTSGIDCKDSTLGNNEWFILLSLSIAQSLVIATGAAYMFKDY